MEILRQEISPGDGRDVCLRQPLDAVTRAALSGIAQYFWLPLVLAS